MLAFCQVQAPQLQQLRLKFQQLPQLAQRQPQDLAKAFLNNQENLKKP
jgi:hypothetical protein